MKIVDVEGFTENGYRGRLGEINHRGAESYSEFINIDAQSGDNNKLIIDVKNISPELKTIVIRLTDF